jgi:transcriptional regulator with XRE-family HTH domain
MTECGWWAVYDHEPTVRSRYLGQELSRAAHKTGHNASDMAELLGCSPSKVSRLLSGKRATSKEDVAAFLALCGVVGNTRKELLALTGNAYEKVWWQDYGARLPVYNPALADNEAIAVRITCYADTVVPDLLQVPDYTRALLAAQPSIPDGEIDERIDETHRRQRILDHEFGPPDLRLILSDYALTRTGAGRAVMSDQAHHLLRLAVRPGITLRVLPDEAEVGDIKPFTLLEFTQHQPAVYLEDTTWTAFLEQPETITAYRTTLDALDQLALNKADSRDRIADIAQRRSAPSAQPAGIWASG